LIKLLNKRGQAITTKDLKKENEVNLKIQELIKKEIQDEKCPDSAFVIFETEAAY